MDWENISFTTDNPSARCSSIQISDTYAYKLKVILTTWKENKWANILFKMMKVTYTRTVPSVPLQNPSKNLDSNATQ